MGLEKQGVKPSGAIGSIIGRMMNAIHTKAYINYFKNKMPENNSCILDIGCGGGKFLKFLSNENATFKLIGIDHSEKMVSLSKKINKKAIAEGCMKVTEASVDDLPIENEKCNLATAFETIQFWPNLEKSISEVARILKPNGKFLIINRYPKEGTKWHKLAQIKCADDYVKKLQSNGFQKVSTDLSSKKGWIIAEAYKF